MDWADEKAKEWLPCNEYCFSDTAKDLHDQNCPWSWRPRVAAALREERRASREAVIKELKGLGAYLKTYADECRKALKERPREIGYDYQAATADRIGEKLAAFIKRLEGK